jgi:acyl phosphate:glycerol-3-phosphate acyltransferase
MLRWLVLVFLAYFLGAIPTGALVARVHGVDLTQHGSRRTGATNALRVLGKPAAALVLGGDVLKGALAVWLAGRLVSHDGGRAVAALVSVIGHTYSVFLGGRGGRGVATGLGGLLALSPPALLCAAAGGLATMAATRYVSLGSLVGAAVGGVALGWRVQQGAAPRAYLLYALVGPLFLCYSHRDNIQRLRSGTERRLGERTSVAERAAEAG